jgi:riboflavin kinase/FMN adenylyltransferase
VLGRSVGYGVEVVPPFLVDGRPVSSGEIRRAIAEGRLVDAERLLGRPYAVTGTVANGGAVTFPMPVALPPAGAYSVQLTPADERSVPASNGLLELEPDGKVHVHRPGLQATGAARLRIVFLDSSVS